MDELRAIGRVRAAAVRTIRDSRAASRWDARRACARTRLAYALRWSAQSCSARLQGQNALKALTQVRASLSTIFATALLQ